MTPALQVTHAEYATGDYGYPVLRLTIDGHAANITNPFKPDLDEGRVALYSPEPDFDWNDHLSETDRDPLGGTRNPEVLRLARQFYDDLNHGRFREGAVLPVQGEKPLEERKASK